MLGNLINSGVMVVSLLSEWEYESMEELADKAEWEADKVRQLDVWLEDISSPNPYGYTMSHLVYGKLVR